MGGGGGAGRQIFSDKSVKGLARWLGRPGRPRQLAVGHRAFRIERLLKEGHEARMAQPLLHPARLGRPHVPPGIISAGCRRVRPHHRAIYVMMEGDERREGFARPGMARAYAPPPPPWAHV